MTRRFAPLWLDLTRRLAGAVPSWDCSTTSVEWSPPSKHAHDVQILTLSEEHVDSKWDGRTGAEQPDRAAGVTGRQMDESRQRCPGGNAATRRWKHHERQWRSGAPYGCGAHFGRPTQLGTVAPTSGTPAGAAGDRGLFDRNGEPS